MDGTDRVDDGVGVLPGGAAHEAEPGAESVGCTCRSHGEIHRWNPVRPGQMVVSDGRHPAQQGLRHADGGRRRTEFRVDGVVAVGLPHHRQPPGHPHTAGAGQRPERGLQQVVVGVDQARGDDAAGDVDDLGVRGQDGGDRPVDDGDIG